MTYRPYSIHHFPHCDACQDTGTIWGENVFGEALAPRECTDKECCMSRTFR